jgi:hypothetical protein
MTEEGVLELNWMWLPTWLGFNSTILEEISSELLKEAVGKEATDDSLNQLDKLAKDILVKKFPEIIGLEDYLDGLKFVSFAEQSMSHGS